MERSFELNCKAITNKLGKKLTRQHPDGSINIVKESDLFPGHADKYLASGHIIEVNKNSASKEDENTSEQVDDIQDDEYNVLANMYKDLSGRSVRKDWDKAKISEQIEKLESK